MGILQMYWYSLSSILWAINGNNVVNHKVRVFWGKFNIRNLSYVEKIYMKLYREELGKHFKNGLSIIKVKHVYYIKLEEKKR